MTSTVFSVFRNAMPSSLHRFALLLARSPKNLLNASPSLKSSFTPLLWNDTSRPLTPQLLIAARNFRASPFVCAGHSKWKNIRHKKEAMDSKKSAVFSKFSRELRSALIEAGDDPDKNIRLAAVLEKAKTANVPKANIERTIERLSHRLQFRRSRASGALERVIFEAKGPGSSVLLIDVYTDNRKRTLPLLRRILTKHNGTLESSGAVSWMFKETGSVEIEGVSSEEKVMEAVVESDANDYEFDEEDKAAIIYCEPTAVPNVRKVCEEMGFGVSSSGVEQSTEQIASLSDEDRELFDRLVSALEDHEDVDSVSHNVEE